MKKKRWPVIDTHFHVGVNPISSFIAEEELLPYMDENNIDVQIIFQAQKGFYHRTPDWNPYIGNDYVAKIQDMCPERIIGLATIDYHLEAPETYVLPYDKRGGKCSLVKRNIAIEELDRCILELGLRGLKIHPKAQNMSINNKAQVYPVLRRLSELQEKLGKKMIVVVHAAGDSVNNAPEAVAETAKNFPELLFIAAHAGFIWGVGTACDMFGDVPNILMDLTACTTKQVPITFAERFEGRRMSAGTDGPHVPYSMKMVNIDDLFEGKDPQQKEMVLGGNLAQILGIPMIEYEEE